MRRGDARAIGCATIIVTACFIAGLWAGLWFLDMSGVPAGIY